ncbi:MAG: GIY-YIG nuclease family protein [Acidobacteriota bacterium]
MLSRVELKWSPQLAYIDSNLQSQVPPVAGVYFISALLDQKLKVVYVGKTNDLQHQLRNHRRFFEPNPFLKSILEQKECYFRVCEIPEPTERRNVEYTLFRYYHPMCNLIEPQGESVEVNLD